MVLRIFKEIVELNVDASTLAIVSNVIITVVGGVLTIATVWKVSK